MYINALFTCLLLTHLTPDVEIKRIEAGLLTSPNLTPSRIYSGKECQVLKGVTVAGTVTDFHRIPY